MRNEILPLFVVPIFLCIFGLTLSISLDVSNYFNKFDQKVYFDAVQTEKWVDMILKK